MRGKHLYLRELETEEALNLGNEKKRLGRGGRESGKIRGKRGRESGKRGRDIYIWGYSKHFKNPSKGLTKRFKNAPNGVFAEIQKKCFENAL